MAAGLYMDVHVPLAVTNQLRRRGVDVLTVYEDGNSSLDDEILLTRATELGRVMVTQDIRFYSRAASWQLNERRFSGLAFAHQLSITIGQLVRGLELIAKASKDGECENQIFSPTFLSRAVAELDATASSRQLERAQIRPRAEANTRIPNNR